MTNARFVAALSDVPAEQWDALRPDDNPFLSHAFLHGLEQHGCLQPRYGWVPHHLLLDDGERLLAAAPCYLKANSHGEFVFDHAWAEAYWRNGIDYYPKLLCAVPYSPVTGPRLLTGPDDSPALRAQAMRALCDEVRRRDLSSAHITFDQHAGPTTADDASEWRERFDWQFHWRNPAGAGPAWRNFDDFLGALNAKKRKNIRQERAQVASAGVSFRHLNGAQATDADLQSMFDFYLATFSDKGNLPVLTLAFLRHLASSMPEQLLLVLADRGGRTIAGALFLHSRRALYGRYWGCSEPLPGLHFETCYYQGIDYCLAHGIPDFEPGAQGEHKLARGFLPARTRSLHYIADPRFRSAVGDALRREAQWQTQYRDDLLLHSPYRLDAVAPAPP